MLLFSLGGIDLPLTKQTTPIITMMTTQASTTPMINTLLSLSLLLSTVRVDPPTFPSPKALVVVGVVEGVDVVVKEAVVTIIVVANGPLLSLLMGMLLVEGLTLLLALFSLLLLVLLLLLLLV